MSGKTIVCDEKQVHLQDAITTSDDVGDMKDLVSPSKIQFGDFLRKSYRENVDKIIDDFLKEFIEKIKTMCIQSTQLGFRKYEFSLFRDFQVYCRNNNYSNTLYVEEEDTITNKLNMWATSEGISVTVNGPSKEGSARHENSYDTIVKW